MGLIYCVIFSRLSLVTVSHSHNSHRTSQSHRQSQSQSVVRSTQSQSQSQTVTVTEHRHRSDVSECQMSDVRCQIRQVQVHVLAYLCLFGRLVEGLPLKLWKVLLLTHPAATVGNVGPDLQDLDRRVGICVPREHRSKSAQCSHATV